jgi:hypothetical protein
MSILILPAALVVAIGLGWLSSYLERTKFKKGRVLKCGGLTIRSVVKVLRPKKKT